MVFEMTKLTYIINGQSLPPFLGSVVTMQVKNLSSGFGLAKKSQHIAILPYKNGFLLLLFLRLLHHNFLILPKTI